MLCMDHRRSEHPHGGGGGAGGSPKPAAAGSRPKQAGTIRDSQWEGAT